MQLAKLSNTDHTLHDFLDWQRSNHSFERMAELEMGEAAITDLADPFSDSKPHNNE